MADASSDKVLLPICGKPTLQYSLEAFAASNAVDSLVIVFRDIAQRNEIETLIPAGGFSDVTWAQGGQERQDSVWAGLSANESANEVVLIHDGARPLITPTTIDAVAEAARAKQVACVAKKTTDTIKLAQSSNDGYILQTLDRFKLWAMETPQAFRTSLITDCYRKVIETEDRIIDDLSAIEDLGLAVSFIENQSPNPKITTSQDIPYVEFLIKRFNP